MIAKRNISAAIISQSLLMLASVILSVRTHLSLWAMVGLSLLACLFFAAHWIEQRLTPAGWVLSVFIACFAFQETIWRPHFAVIFGMVAVASWLGGIRWRALAMTWALVPALILLAAGYNSNQSILFFCAWCWIMVWIAFLRVGFDLRPIAIVAANTVLLVLVLLPTYNFFVGPTRQPRTWHKYYSFNDSRANPESFARWYAFYHQEEYPRMGRQIFDVLPHQNPGHRLRPNSHCVFYQCPIFINSQGFRGPEIPPDKENTYRIVALGESTTFGMTLAATDKPWPDLLEEMIRERLHPNRPVEVINAGVPAYALRHNVPRLQREILPLKPDMIISYHGYNDFNLIESGLAPRTGAALPEYKERPLRLLGDIEYRIKMHDYIHRYGLLPPTPVPAENPLESPYAAHYRELFRFTETNRIRLVLANYSMAVNTNSDSRVIAFYRAGFPNVEGDMAANEKHSYMVRELAAQHPEICFVDTHPHLDGEHEKFIDLIHFTQEGRQQMAETMFAGIRKVLEKDLKLESTP